MSICWTFGICSLYGGRTSHMPATLESWILCGLLTKGEGSGISFKTPKSECIFTVHFYKSPCTITKSVCTYKSATNLTK